MKTRKCKNPACGKVLKRRHDEFLCRFARRQFCNQKCHGSSISTPVLTGRKCKGCSRLLRKRLLETNSVYNKRMNCNVVCAAKSKQTLTDPKRICGSTVCGRQLHQRANEKFYGYAKRLHCNRKCRNVHDRTIVVHGRVCAARACGKLLVQRSGEVFYTFNKRKYCKRACQRHCKTYYLIMGVSLSVRDVSTITGKEPSTIFARHSLGLCLLTGTR